MSNPLSASTVKGAILALSTSGPPRAVPFQYNPDEVVRTITPHARTVAEGVGGDARRIWGAPNESISLTIELDAADSVGEHRSLAPVGVQARLAALQLLISPDLVTAVKNDVLTAAGAIIVLPPAGPLVVLSLGPARTVPIVIESLTVTEQAFDPNMVPIRASVRIETKVLTYSDTPITDPAHVLALARQAQDEALALLTPMVAIEEA